LKEGEWMWKEEGERDRQEVRISIPYLGKIGVLSEVIAKMVQRRVETDGELVERVLARVGEE